MARDEDRNGGAALPDDDDDFGDIEQGSWLERLGESVGAIIFGVVLIGSSGIWLFWNEAGAVRAARTSSDGSAIVRALAADTIDPANEGKLVHVVGALTTGGPAADLEFGVKSPGVRLKRTVEMFQWTETAEMPEGSGGRDAKPTYKYERGWFDHPVDSEKFDEWRGHANPPMIYRTHLILAPNPRLGAFIVPPNLLYRFGVEEPLTVSEQEAAALQKRMKRPVHVVEGGLYVGDDPAHPEVGDLRVTFTHVPLQTANVVAEQAGQTFDLYHASSGGPIEVMLPGRSAPAGLFNAAEEKDQGWTWLWRAGGCVLMFLGFVLVMGPLSGLADTVPVLREIADAGVGVLALLCTAILASLVMAGAWLLYRAFVAEAVLGGGLLLAVAAGWLAHRHVRSKSVSPA